jgi:hypothetical protein
MGMAGCWHNSSSKARNPKVWVIEDNTNMNLLKYYGVFLVVLNTEIQKKAFGWGFLYKEQECERSLVSEAITPGKRTWYNLGPTTAVDRQESNPQPPRYLTFFTLIRLPRNEQANGEREVQWFKHEHNLTEHISFSGQTWRWTILSGLYNVCVL